MPAPPSIRPFARVGAIGLAVFVFSAVLLRVFPSDAGPMPPGFSTPIIAFEFVSTAQEAASLFQVSDPPAFAAAMDRGNQLDFIYLLLYGGFLFAFHRRAAQLYGPSMAARIAMALAVIAPLADIAENIQLFGITEAVMAGQDVEPYLGPLAIFTRIKWGALSLGFIAGAIALWPHGRGPKFIALATAGSTLQLVAALFDRRLTEIYTVSIAVMFLGLVLFCFLVKQPPSDP